MFTFVIMALIGYPWHKEAFTFRQTWIKRTFKQTKRTFRQTTRTSDISSISGFRVINFSAHFLSKFRVDLNHIWVIDRHMPLLSSLIKWVEYILHGQRKWTKYWGRFCQESEIAILKILPTDLVLFLSPRWIFFILFHSEESLDTYQYSA